MKEIILQFDLDSGEVAVEAKGFAGPSCKQATEFIEKSLGQSKDFKRKAEWFASNIRVSGGLSVNSNRCG